MFFIFDVILIIYIIIAYAIQTIAFRTKNTFLAIKHKLHFDILGMMLLNVLLCTIVYKAKNTIAMQCFVTYGRGMCNLTIGILLQLITYANMFRRCYKTIFYYILDKLVLIYI